MDTVTILPTRTVTRVLVGGTYYDLPAGTTDVTARSKAECVMRSRNCVWGYGGPVEASTMVVVAIRGRDWRKAAAAAETRLAKLLAKENKAVAS